MEPIGTRAFHSRNLHSVYFYCHLRAVSRKKQISNDHIYSRCGDFFQKIIPISAVLYSSLTRFRPVLKLKRIVHSFAQALRFYNPKTVRMNRMSVRLDDETRKNLLGGVNIVSKTVRIFFVSLWTTEIVEFKRNRPIRNISRRTVRVTFGQSVSGVGLRFTRQRL